MQKISCQYGGKQGCYTVIYEAQTLHLGYHTQVRHGTCLGHFCMRVPAMSFFKYIKKNCGTLE